SGAGSHADNTGRRSGLRPRRPRIPGDPIPPAPTLVGDPGRRGRSPDLRPGGDGGVAPTRSEGVAEAGERALPDRLAHARHQRLVVPEVVQGAQDRRQHLVAAVQVAQVGAAVAIAAGMAAAALLDRARVLLVLRVADADGAGRSEVVAVARVAGRHDAIEHVDAARDRLDQVLGPADAHQVAWALARQLRHGVLEHGVALGLRLAHGQATDRVAVEADLLQPLGRTRAQVAVHPALDDAEQRRVVALVGALRAFRPAQRQLHRSLDHARVNGLAVDVHRRALVEDHHDVRAEHFLDAHALLGPEEHGRAVGR